MATIVQDAFSDFYPPNVGAPISYTPPMSDAAPQAATITGSMSAGGGNYSTVLWALALVAGALILMHIAADV